VSPSISTECENCGNYFRIVVQDTDEVTCSHCSKTWQLSSKDFIGIACPICGCKGFFTQKDFNQVLGCAVMLLGIVFVPWTYGLSLPVFAFIDWLLYKRINTMAVCYRCRAEFRGFDIPEAIEPFDHFKGMKYEPKQLHLKRKQ